MPHRLVKTHYLESLINKTSGPCSEKAAEELNGMFNMLNQLETHLLAIKAHNDSAISGVESLIQSIEPEVHGLPHLLRRRLE